MEDTDNIVSGGRESREQLDSVNNIFDTVFRTMMEYLPYLIIPVINELFRTSYRMDDAVRVLKNEHVTRSGTLITDLHFELGQKRYHVEVQSSHDGRMVIRIMEYAAAIAIENAQERQDGSFHMKIPNSCVICLRPMWRATDKLTMHVEFPGGECVAFDVPLLKVQEYTKDELFRKNLLMLLPYYLMRYEKELKEIGKLEPGLQEEAEQRMEVFLEEYRDICDRLFAACEVSQSYYLYTALAEQIKSIAEYLAPKDQKERVAAMGGTVIKPQAQIILEQGIEQGLERGIEQGLERGIEQGLERGIEQGKRETVFSLAEMGMPLEQIAQAVKIGVDTVKQWLEGGVDQADMRALRG